VDGRQDLGPEALAAHLGAHFTVRGGSFEGTALSLARVEEHGGAPGYETFALVFEGPPEVRLEQATYELENDRFGRQAIFLVPLAPRGDRSRYEAVFNRPTR
jgi:hypothetical protein